MSLQLEIGVYNALASKICVKLLKPPKIQIPTPNPLSEKSEDLWYYSISTIQILEYNCGSTALQIVSDINTIHSVG
jgi:hypothetical protein